MLRKISSRDIRINRRIKYIEHVFTYGRYRNYKINIVMSMDYLGYLFLYCRYSENIKGVIND